ncbi:DUF4126 domain-containing protein [Actinomadura bangladeshensis]|uniref:DUF4126 domain-containing protein n=1 Tax=Actinomadura bangladeshensis TaxID=453573 RepID=A0A6L9QDS0_9ACTN|nr:DUF4126 domain-containing protein [Actinomadura bangladeshensis]NEA23218.1 DUF4126 domain-containing protein [Actinomadura bangladeshensis]
MLAALTGLGLSAAAGLNAYIPMLVVGLIARYSDLVRLPAEFGWLTDGRVLAGLGVLLAAEIVLDKVPVVDSVNDAVQTFVRPAAGGAVFAATDAAGRLDSSAFMHEHPWIGWTLGIAVALLVHATKASVRPVANAGTMGAGAPVLSTAEDAASLVMSVLAIIAPVIGLIALLLTGYAGFRLLRRRRRRRAARRSESGRSAPT